MKRHKWGEIQRPFSQKMQTCEKCGIERYWMGGYMQCWEYLDLQSALGTQRTTLYRPECNPDRGQTQGFNRYGKYIYYDKVKGFYTN